MRYKLPRFLAKLFNEKVNKAPEDLPPVKTLSGSVWIGKFPDKTSLDQLVSPFKENAKNFITAMETATFTIDINSVLRPKERAYLMHWSWNIGKLKADAKSVPAMDSVDIEWWHGTQSASETAALTMVTGYGTKRQPSLTSNHTKGLAVDMNITQFSGKKIKKADNTFVTVGTFDELVKVGESYNVFHKVLNDMPHWSIDGY